MGNPLLATLQSNDKLGLFSKTQTAISYPSGFLPLDYHNGYVIEVRNLKEELLMKYNSIGVAGGTFITIVGKSGTAKTTFAVQLAAKIVQPFESGLVLHYDLEQALQYTRIKNITGYSQLELNDKYILKQEKNCVEDIFDAIMDICNSKRANKDQYTYDTGVLNEFGDKISMYIPTVVIIDSLPSLSSREASKEEIDGSTYASRMAKVLTQWCRKLVPYIKECNITIIVINHINAKIEMNAFQRTQPQLMTMKVDESLPGGNASIYYANHLFKFVSCGKYTAEDDGFDGFKIRCELLKSRTNKASQFCHLVYDQTLGFDPVLTLYDYALEHKLVEGKNPYRYITGYKDLKFDSRKFREEFKECPELQDALFKTIYPYLIKSLSEVGDELKLNRFEIVDRLLDSQDKEEREV